MMAIKGKIKMLVKCPECGNDVSSEAAACPKCGQPTEQPKPPLPAKKISHSAGWISLAAFVLANFSPAILAPIFVLVGLIFAGKEMSGGGRGFGIAVLCLSLVQGWFVLDHFGHISGTLGISTAKDADTQAASRYANVSLNLPGDWHAVAESKCREEWPTDYRMQQHCVTQQSEGAQTLERGSPTDVDTTAFRVIRGKCAEDWPRDFKMRAHCEKQQFEGFRSLGASASGAPLRNSCAQQWPNDFRMRQYCESKAK